MKFTKTEISIMIVSVVAVLAAVFLIVENSLASVTLAQPYADTNVATDYVLRQTLGTGLTGTFSTFEYRAGGDATGSLRVYECNSNLSTNPASNCTIIINVNMGASASNYVIVDNAQMETIARPSYTFNPSKYYEIDMHAGDTSRSVSTYGTSTSRYANGILYSGPGAACEDSSSCTVNTTTDAYFSFYSDTGERIVWSYPPLNATTTIVNNEFTASATITGLTPTKIYSVYFIAELQSQGTGTSSWPAESQFIRSASLAAAVSSTYLQLPMKLENGVYGFAAAIFEGLNLDPNFQGYLSRSLTNAEVSANDQYISPPPDNNFLGGSVFYEAPTSSQAFDCTMYQWTDTYFGAIPFFASSSPDRAVCELKSFIRVTIDETINYAKGSIGAFFTALSTAFPFNIYTSVNSALSEAEASSTNPAPIVISNTHLYGSREFVLYNGSTTLWINANTGFDYRDFLSKAMYAGTYIFIMLISLRFFMKAMGHQSQPVQNKKV